MSENAKINLTDEELARLASNGDDAAMALLIAKIMPVAKAKASKHGGPRLSSEDLVQEGMLGFLDAVKSYRSEKGVPFKAYAETCINNRIVSAVRVNYNHKNAALTNAVSIEEETDKLLSRNDDPAVIVSDKDGSEQLKRLLVDDLSDFERQVIELRLLDKSYAQIALSLECSEKAVDNALQRIRKKIRSQI
ncbi:MAG: sigma-70 family RNA polymerase sigma factor [Clostridia bacterium]|nr:sigma-70 family RNA polymerase sigma factor [Clostridia bacterium]